MTHRLRCDVVLCANIYSENERGVIEDASGICLKIVFVEFVRIVRLDKVSSAVLIGADNQILFYRFKLGVHIHQAVYCGFFLLAQFVHFYEVLYLLVFDLLMLFHKFFDQVGGSMFLEIKKAEQFFVFLEDNNELL